MTFVTMPASASQEQLEDLHLLHRDRERSTKRKLDEALEEKERTHRELIANASAAHKRIRLNAERTRELFRLQREQERQRAEQEEQLRLEQVKAELAARQRQAEFDKEQQERERIQREHEDLERRRRLDEERRVLERAQREEQERQKRQKQEDERRAAELAATRAQAAKDKAEKDAAQNRRATNPTGVHTQQVPAPTEANITTLLRARKTQHVQYLALHKQLKELRKSMAEFAKRDQAFKQWMGDARRFIRAKVGQMIDGTSKEIKEGNLDRIKEIRAVLQQALQTDQHYVDIRHFVIPAHQGQYPDDKAQVSGLFIYLLNQVSKSAMSQMVEDAGIKPTKAEPLGLLVTSIFGHNLIQVAGQLHLADIHLAKYHHECPALFGIYDILPKGFTSEYAEKMTGLAAGFAATTLRKYPPGLRSKNPFPSSLYWSALARIVNTPPAAITDTLFIVLKALLDPAYAAKFIEEYGNIGILLLKRAVVEFPASSNNVAAMSIKVMADLYAKKLNLRFV
ncbi:hypothetical protein NA57DRAFT_79902 [Rhizodiscina lignyota]|uniref:mRNA export factor GLE1 n=1 Tax=Rhizodiscina lignyota TaxID=1504668 RepID=A0A9P4I8B6_9PEZI|nr:hypothetical protein NA57DRAFT_79902 [Rhizodiscina lignyota]